MTFDAGAGPVPPLRVPANSPRSSRNRRATLLVGYARSGLRLASVGQVVPPDGLVEHRAALRSPGSGMGQIAATSSSSSARQQCVIDASRRHLDRDLRQFGLRGRLLAQPLHVRQLTRHQQRLGRSAVTPSRAAISSRRTISTPVAASGADRVVGPPVRRAWMNRSTDARPLNGSVRRGRVDEVQFGRLWPRRPLPGERTPRARVSTSASRGSNPGGRCGAGPSAR